MAIPLRALSLPKAMPDRSRESMDSETSAILSYALGKHVDNDSQTSDNDDSPRASSTHLDENDEEEFFKENDPLAMEYEPFPKKQVSFQPSTQSLNPKNGRG